MKQFENINVIKQAHIYFGGNIISRTLELANGKNKGLGIMMPGEYTFTNLKMKTAYCCSYID